jgi:predicted RNase H-like HicB family nuclease
MPLLACFRARLAGSGSLPCEEVAMPLTVEVEQEEDGRWLAEVPQLPGVLAYGQTREESVGRAEALALRVLADRPDAGEPVPHRGTLF